MFANHSVHSKCSNGYWNDWYCVCLRIQVSMDKSTPTGTCKSTVPPHTHTHSTIRQWLAATETRVSWIHTIPEWGWERSPEEKRLMEAWRFFRTGFESGHPFVVLCYPLLIQRKKHRSPTHITGRDQGSSLILQSLWGGWGRGKAKHYLQTGYT